MIMNTAHKTIGSLLGIALAILLSNTALANEHKNSTHKQARHERHAQHSVDAREHRQQGRVAQGVSSGQLTRDEAKKLRTQQRDIRAEEKQYRSDGKFTKEERKDVQRDLNQASKDIYKEKHDAETRK
jgi:hypothetical protein